MVPSVTVRAGGLLEAVATAWLPVAVQPAVPDSKLPLTRTGLAGPGVDTGVVAGVAAGVVVGTGVGVAVAVGVGVGVGIGDVFPVSRTLSSSRSTLAVVADISVKISVAEVLFAVKVNVFGVHQVPVP